MRLLSCINTLVVQVYKCLLLCCSLFLVFAKFDSIVIRNSIVKMQNVKLRVEIPL